MTYDQRVRLDDDLAASVRAYAEANHISMSAAIKILLSKGLATETR